MLLPSAFPFDACHQSQQHRSSHINTSSTHSPSSPGGWLSLSSSKALQAILGGGTGGTCRSKTSSPSPLSMPPVYQQRKPQQTPQSAAGPRSSPKQSSRRKRPPLRLITPNERFESPEPSLRPAMQSTTHGQNRTKRNRSEFEQADQEDASGMGPQMTLGPSGNFSFSQNQDRFSTPKRQRRAPLLMPLGLSAEDFAGLGTTPQAQPSVNSKHKLPQIHLPADSSTCAQFKTEEDTWSIADDRVLVSTVLRKLNLSCDEWNNCAAKLDEQSDTFGKRWKTLLGEEEAVLRRGCGAKTRPKLSCCWSHDGQEGARQYGIGKKTI